MALTVDANVLIHASNDDSERQGASQQFLRDVVTSGERLVLFVPVLLAYLRTATRPGVFRQPLSPALAADNVRQLLNSSNAVLATEREGFWNRLVELVISAGLRGPVVHDAHIAVLMAQHDVRTIATYDRDFRRFDGIRVVEPGVQR